MAKNQGIQSREVKQVGYRQGARREGINPGWVGQRGQKVGEHAELRDGVGYRGEKRSAGPGYPSELGNANALKSAGVKNGAGCNRTLYGQSGTNQMHGAPVAGNPPQRNELFPGWPTKSRP
jgi:hypothetical protein